jgi:hypothetical protein
VGFSIFCLISINQIGVGIWGFVALGILINSLGKHNEDRFETSKSKSRSAFSRRTESGNINMRAGKDESRNFLDSLVVKTFITLVCTGTVLFFTVSINVTDAQFLSAIKSNNLQEASDLTKRFAAMDFHKEVLVSALTRAGRDEEALKLAIEVVSHNPRNWASWVAIVASDLSTVEQKEEAAGRLFDLDPNNTAVREELTAFLDSLVIQSR